MAYKFGEAYVDLVLRMGKFGTQIQQAQQVASSHLDKMQKRFDSLSSGFDKFGKFALKTFAVLGTATAAVLKPTIDIEAGYLQVAKTTGMVGKEMEGFQKTLENMARTMPGIRMKGLQEIAATAGQLGIKGSENISKFTGTVARMTVATDYTADEAAAAMARLTNVMKLPLGDAEKLASTMTMLANNTTAVASELGDIMLRMGGSARVIGMTAAETAALAATMRDAGINIEVAGTSMSQILLKMLKDTDKFAQVAKVSIGEFEAALRDKPVKALEMVLRGLAGMDKFARSKALEMLELRGVRTGETLLKMADAVDMLNVNMESARKEWSLGTTLMTVYQTFAKGLGAQLTLLRNNVELFANSIGKNLAPAVRSFVTGFSDHLKSWSKWIDAHPKAVRNIGEMVMKLTVLLGVLGGTSIALGGLFKWLGWITMALQSLLPKITNAKIAMVGLKTAGVAAAGAAGYAFGRWIATDRAFTIAGKTLDQYTKGWWNAFWAVKRFGDELERVQGRTDVVKRLKLEADEIRDIFNDIALSGDLKAKYPDLKAFEQDVISMMNVLVLAKGKMTEGTEAAVAALEDRMEAMKALAEEQGVQAGGGGGGGAGLLSSEDIALSKEYKDALRQLRGQLDVYIARSNTLNEITRKYRTMGAEKIKVLQDIQKQIWATEDAEKALAEAEERNQKRQEVLARFFEGSGRASEAHFNNLRADAVTYEYQLMKVIDATRAHAEAQRWLNEQMKEALRDDEAIKRMEEAEQRQVEAGQLLDRYFAGIGKGTSEHLDRLVDQASEYQLLLEGIVGKTQAAAEAQRWLKEQAKEATEGGDKSFVQSTIENMQKSFKEAYEGFTNLSITAMNMFMEFANQVSGTVASVIDDMFEGRMKKVSDYLKDFFKNLLKMVLQMVAQMMVWKFILGPLGGAMGMNPAMNPFGGTKGTSMPQGPRPPMAIHAPAPTILIANYLSPEDVVAAGIKANPNVVMVPVVRTMQSMALNPVLQGSM